MSIWLHKINIKEGWQQAENNEITVQQLSLIIAPKLQACGFADEGVCESRDLLVDELYDFAKDPTANKNDFDELWAEIYDFSDDNRIWINRS